MAARKKGKSRSRRGGSASTSTRRRTASGDRRKKDAIELLKADHRQVEKWFGQFKSSRASAKKERLAAMICEALRVHTRIEEEIFYPAFLEAAQEEDLHHEAQIEHDAAKKLIAEIESSDPGDEFFSARVKVLAEMIRHHVNEEEKRDGMFAKARRAGMDLVELGAQLADRKAELQGAGDSTARALESAADVSMTALP